MWTKFFLTINLWDRSLFFHWILNILYCMNYIYILLQNMILCDFHLFRSLQYYLIHVYIYILKYFDKFIDSKSPHIMVGSESYRKNDIVDNNFNWNIVFFCNKTFVFHKNRKEYISIPSILKYYIFNIMTKYSIIWFSNKFFFINIQNLITSKSKFNYCKNRISISIIYFTTYIPFIKVRCISYAYD